MFTRILVPLDGSAVATAAIPFASTLARVFQSQIAVLSVLEPPPQGFARLQSANAEMQERARSLMTAYIEKSAADLRALGITTTTVVRQGKPASEICVCAEEIGAGLIVMTTHGRTGFARVRLGSVAQRVVQRGTIPTLVVHANEPGKAEVTADIAGVLVTLDGSLLAEQAIPPGCALAGALAVPLTLFRVLPNYAYAYPSAWDGGYYGIDPELEQAREWEVISYLTAVAAPLRQEGRVVQTAWDRSATNRGDQEITSYLAAHPRTLAVMASHGRGGFERWMLGSTTEAVLAAAPYAVLVIHANVQADEADAASRPLISAV